MRTVADPPVAPAFRRTQAYAIGGLASPAKSPPNCTQELTASPTAPSFLALHMACTPCTARASHVAWDTGRGVRSLRLLLFFLCGTLNEQALDFFFLFLALDEETLHLFFLLLALDE